jgi:hypothetical protein
MGSKPNENLEDYGKVLNQEALREATQEAAQEQEPGIGKVPEEREVESGADANSGEAPADTPDEPEGA